MINLKRLNAKGISHLLLLLSVVVSVAVFGTFMLVASRAATPENASVYTDASIGYDSENTNSQLKDKEDRLPPSLKLSANKKASSSSVILYSRSKTVALSKKMARSYWSMVPNQQLCSESRRGRNVAIKFVNLKDDPPKGGYEFITLAYTYLNGKNPHTPTRDCTIYADRIKYPKKLNIYQATNLCMTIIHEYGHLYGYKHNKRPDSIMNLNYKGYIRRCDKVTPGVY